MNHDHLVKLEITPPDSARMMAYNDLYMGSPLPSPSFTTYMTSSAASTPTPYSENALSRKLSRKSTLTQQQKNAKRQRATQDQLELLEHEFCLNPTPTAAVRERIAQDIDMTERSVQIWFQNRRAKMKNLVKKNIENGEDVENIPESMRKYLAMQALESGRPFLNEGAMGDGLTPYGSGLLLNTDGASKVMVYNLSCSSLYIGTWARVGQTQLDLVVFYSPVQSMMTYYIQAENNGYKIEYPFSHIKHITLNNGDVSAVPQGYSNHCNEPGLIVELYRPPIFSMDRGSSGWFQCPDFTQDHQASTILVHQLGGHPSLLGDQLNKLVSLEAYQNRHASLEPKIEHLSVPVDPIGFRPSSQPNHIVHPRASLFPDHNFTIPHPPRGHKRQRSRSVPVAIDFSQLRPSKAPFIMHQHQHTHVHTHMGQHETPRMFAPVPQHVHPIPFQYNRTPLGPLGSTLSIDTSAGYGMDFPPCPPSSSTVGTSPPSSSEYEQSFVSAAPASNTFALSPMDRMNMSYPKYLSPLAEHPNHQYPESSPLSMHSHPGRLMTTYPQESPLMHRTPSVHPPLAPIALGLKFQAPSSAIEDVPSPARTISNSPEEKSPAQLPLPPSPPTHTLIAGFEPTTSQYLTPAESQPSSQYFTPAGPQPSCQYFNPAETAPTHSQPSPASTTAPPASQQSHSDLSTGLSTELTTPSQLSLSLVSDSEWLSSNSKTNSTHMSSIPEDDPLAGLLYDSYLIDPLSDPFLEALGDSHIHHPLHDPILESLHRHSRSKPSISTLAFRTMERPGNGGASASASANTGAQARSPVFEEFSFGHMVNMSEDFGNSRSQ